MSPERQRTVPQDERATAKDVAAATTAAAAAAAVRHSAFAEFQRDERRPAILLLGALVIAALFFALGIMLGRWMADDTDGSVRRPPDAVNRPSVSPVPPSERP